MIGVMGVSHRRTPVERREKLTVAPQALLATLRRARQGLAASECVVLSTCNRTELYFVSDRLPPDARVLFEWVVNGAAPAHTAREHDIYLLREREAATHLCRVAAGLDSLILGEHEILGQVKAAWQAAHQSGSAGPLLSKLFHHAARAGKRARAETGIAAGGFSIGHCAARAARQALGDLRGKALLVIGAGRIAEATAKHLAHHGVSPITVANRTAQRAHEVAQRLGAGAATMRDIADLLPCADLVVTCTSAPHLILDLQMVRRAAAQRPGRPQVIIDLGVPRDVDPRAARLAGVRLFNLDDLEPIVAQGAAARAAQVEAVNAIIAQEIRSFEEWQRRRELMRMERGACGAHAPGGESGRAYQPG